MQVTNTLSNTAPVVYPNQLLTNFSPVFNNLSHDYVKNAELIRTVLEQALLAKNISVFCDCV